MVESWLFVALSFFFSMLLFFFSPHFNEVLADRFVKLHLTNDVLMVLRGNITKVNAATSSRINAKFLKTLMM